MTTRRVLEVVAGAIPDVGEDVVTRVEIRSGWAGAVHVRVHTLLSREAGGDFGHHLREGMARVLHDRHTVEVVWASAG